VTVKLLQSEPLSVAHVNSTVPTPLCLATASAIQQDDWSKDDKQQLADTGG